jgi:hypothetical protein
MASQFDDSDFVDNDYQRGKPSASAAGVLNRPPTREELESKVMETQQRLSELKRAQEELERERATIEEARRRRQELQTGREELLEQLTRGIGLLEQAEFAARQEAEQLFKTLAGLRDAFAKIEAVQEETWNEKNWNTELTRALTSLENARMEWNSARLKWPVLDGKAPSPMPSDHLGEGGLSQLEQLTFWQLSAWGLALTWPVLLLGLLIVALLTALLLG